MMIRKLHLSARAIAAGVNWAEQLTFLDHGYMGAENKHSLLILQSTFKYSACCISLAIHL